MTFGSPVDFFNTLTFLTAFDTFFLKKHPLIGNYLFRLKFGHRQEKGNTYINIYFFYK
jgi:hypothetical protein